VLLTDCQPAAQIQRIGTTSMIDPSITNTTKGDPAVGAQENKQAARDAYAAFSRGDAEGAMRDIDDSIEWIVRGENALTGTYNGKQAVGELWGRFMSKDFRTDPHDFVAEGDKVVVLTTVHLEGEAIESADVLTYNANGKLVAFDTLADEVVPNRVFAR
jgi:ketosteroid isomerase-like protein